MVKAYVLIKAEPGRTQEVVAALRAHQSVQQADAITGPADIIAQVTALDARALSDLIFSSIQAIEGVRETDTRIVVH